MTLTADESIQSISTDEMKYQHGRPNVRQYDSCFYEIGAAPVVDDTKNQTQEYTIQLSVIRATEMNVFLYGGNSRFNATIPMIEGNEPVKVGETYTIDSTLGMLLVAYPNAGIDTEFEFVYTLVPKVIPQPISEVSPSYIYGAIDDVYYYKIAIGALFVTLVLITICIFFCVCKKKNTDLNRVDHRRSTRHVVKASDEESGNVTS